MLQVDYKDDGSREVEDLIFTALFTSLKKNVVILYKYSIAQVHEGGHLECVVSYC